MSKRVRQSDSLQDAWTRLEEALNSTTEGNTFGSILKNFPKFTKFKFFNSSSTTPC